MDKIKSIFNYEKKDIIERDLGLYRWERKPYVKDDVKVLNNLLHKMLKKNRSDTCRFKFGLVDAFKKLCDRLCYISGISPKELGATPIVESDLTKDWFEDDLREWESPSDEWEYER